MKYGLVVLHSRGLMFIVLIALSIMLLFNLFLLIDCSIVDFLLTCKTKQTNRQTDRQTKQPTKKMVLRKKQG